MISVLDHRMTWPVLASRAELGSRAHTADNSLISVAGFSTVGTSGQGARAGSVGGWVLDIGALVSFVEGNAYDRKFPEHLALPRTLWESAQRLKACTMARDWFGNEFVDHFAATREWEEREFRRHITDWEMARYFEII